MDHCGIIAVIADRAIVECISPATSTGFPSSSPSRSRAPRDADCARRRLGAGVAAGTQAIPGRHLIDSLITLPLVLPPTVLGYYPLVLLGTCSRSAGFCITAWVFGSRSPSELRSLPLRFTRCHWLPKVFALHLKVSTPNLRLQPAHHSRSRRPDDLLRVTSAARFRAAWTRLRPHSPSVAHRVTLVSRS